MKKGPKALFVLLFMILTVSGASAAEKINKPEIKTVDSYIAVFDFEVTTGDKGIARPLTESVRREIVMSGRYKVIDRGNMEKILGEQKLQMSGCVTGECIVEAGQLLGVGKLINGTVSMVGKTYYLTLSLISVKTGEIENVAEDKCKCEVDELLDSTKRLAKKLLGEKVESTAQDINITRQSVLPDISGNWYPNHVSGEVYIYSDGRCIYKGFLIISVGGKWSCTDPGKRLFSIVWNHGFTDMLTLSADGKRLEGVNNVGDPVSFVRSK